MDGFEGKCDTERFTVVVHVVVKTLNFAIHVYTYIRIRESNVQKCVLHVHHDHFGFFNQ